MKILIIEDESLIALELAQMVNKLGFEVVDYVTTTKEAQLFLEQNHVELILMDINLGIDDGVVFYKTVSHVVSVIYLSAYEDDATISRALESKPIGYLVKPIRERELFVLLQMAKSKIKNESEQIDIGFGYSFAAREHRLFYQQEYVNLGTKELCLLEMLIEAAGKTVSYSKIEEQIWQNEVRSDSSLRTLIYRLRSKLNPLMIQNEFNLGIWLNIHMQK